MTYFKFAFHFRELVHKDLEIAAVLAVVVKVPRRDPHRFGDGCHLVLDLLLQDTLQGQHFATVHFAGPVSPRKLFGCFLRLFFCVELVVVTVEGFCLSSLSRFGRFIAVVDL